MLYVLLLLLHIDYQTQTMRTSCCQTQWYKCKTDIYLSGMEVGSLRATPLPPVPRTGINCCHWYFYTT